MKKLLMLLLAVLVLCAGCGGDSKKVVDVKNVEPLKPIKQEQPKQEQPKVVAKNFGMDVNTFRAKFNEITKNEKTNQFQITDFYKFDKGSARSSHRHKFNNKLEIMVIEGNQSKKVEVISMTALPNTPQDAMLMTLEHSAIVGVLNPEVPDGKRIDVLRQLKVLGADNLKGLNESISIGNVVYTAMEVQGVLMLMASPK